MNAPYSERPAIFTCDGDELVGIVHTGDCKSTTGVLIVVGGGQYRVGAHRQFVHLARAISKTGAPVFRFDVRGMGDSRGTRRHFTELDDDIRNAIDCFVEANAQIENIIIWGLCDAASASIFYAPKDPRVKGIVMVNPWVTTGKGAANAQLKHYYLARLFSRKFWGDFIQGHVTIAKSIKSLFNIVSLSVKNNGELESRNSLPQRVFDCLERYQGRVLIVLSGNDLTAREFEDAMTMAIQSSQISDKSTVSILKHEEADHTFSTESWRKDLEEWTKNWIQNIT